MRAEPRQLQAGSVLYAQGLALTRQSHRVSMPGLEPLYKHTISKGKGKSEHSVLVLTHRCVCLPEKSKHALSIRLYFGLGPENLLLSGDGRSTLFRNREAHFASSSSSSRPS